MNSSPVKAVDVNEREDLEVGRVEKVYWAEHASMDAERVKVVKAAEEEAEKAAAVRAAVCDWIMMMMWAVPPMMIIFFVTAMSGARTWAQVAMVVAFTAVMMVVHVTVAMVVFEACCWLARPLWRWWCWITYETGLVNAATANA